MKKVSTQDLYEIYKQHPIISKDSRKVTPSCLYFSLKGESFDGNKFAEQALKDGAAYAIVDDINYVTNKNCLLVEDGLKALQDLAIFHRKQLNIPFIGITGSNGKTTTKELIYQVLKSHYNCYATEGNYNNHIGVPLTILSIKSSHEMAIVEMGANHQGEIDFLCSIAQPNYGLITNIGKAHLEGFGGIEGIKKGKSELYRFLKKSNGLIFRNGDDQVLAELAEGMKAITYGSNKENNCIGEIINAKPNIEFKWQYKNENGKAKTQLYGNYNFYNMLAAACIGNYFKVPSEKITTALESYQSQNNRSQFIKNKKGEIYLDAYNANPTSMLAALENFKSIKKTTQLVILGDMFELGEEGYKEHFEIIKQVAKMGFEKACFVGKNFYEHHKNHSDFVFFKSTDEAKAWFSKQDINNHQVLIKGSRGMAMEKLLD